MFVSSLIVTYIHVQCASLRAEVSLLQTRLRNAEQAKERYQEQLIAAEKRVDRLQSKAVATLYPSSWSPDEGNGANEELKEAAKAENGELPPSSQGSPKIVSRLARDTEVAANSKLAG